MKKFNSRLELLRMIQRYTDGLASDEEKKFLEAYYDRFDHEEDIINQLSASEKEAFECKIERFLMHEVDKNHGVKPMWLSIRRISAAAAVMLILSTGLYFYLNRTETKVTQVKKPAAPKHDILPGGNIAVLTLADGTRINLDNANTGTIAEQAGIKISKRSDGQLIYTIASTPVAGRSQTKDVYNTIETPMGGEYQVNLPDGTRVWLNAASSLHYPASFDGRERRVKLSGEAYFEVAANKAKPFLVESKGQLVEVLGTHFNINSYTDERTVKTTLLEGSVKVSIPGISAFNFIKPGQQASVHRSGSSISVANIDVEEAVAWKNGYFTFSDEDIQSIMRQVSRWYNVEVVYKGTIPSESFGGNVSKSKNISEILRILELTKVVHFKVEGRRVIVMH